MTSLRALSARTDPERDPLSDPERKLRITSKSTFSQQLPREHTCLSRWVVPSSSSLLYCIWYLGSRPRNKEKHEEITTADMPAAVKVSTTIKVPSRTIPVPSSAGTPPVLLPESPQTVQGAPKVEYFSDRGLRSFPALCGLYDDKIMMMSLYSEKSKYEAKP